MLQKILAALMLIGSLGSLSACNTIAGAGQDLQQGGAAVSDTARDVQRNM